MATHATVQTENCDLHYWHQGSGPLLLLIPNGYGHGSQYNALMTLLSPTYTMATFDRRGTAGSPNNNSSKTMNHPQQARDICAIITTLGFQKAIIFGSSGGGVCAFQFAVDFPDMVELLLVHEAPTNVLLPHPDSSRALEGSIRIHHIFQTQGAEAANRAFESVAFRGFDEVGVRKRVEPPWENVVNMFEHEWLLGTTYVPDLRKLIKNGVSKRTGILVGKRSGEVGSTESTVVQAEILGCERGVVGGHHFGFECEPEAFMKGLVEMIGILKRKGNEEQSKL